MLDYSYVYISNIERGKVLPSRDFAIAFRKISGISIDEIFSESGPILEGSDKKPKLEDVARKIPVIFYENLHSLGKNCYQIDKSRPSMDVPVQIKFFNAVDGQQYGMTVITKKTGMEPKVSIGDLIIVNFSDIEITKEDFNEDKIYLVNYADQFLLRYVDIQGTSRGRGYVLSREGGRSIFTPNGKNNPILGRIIWVCKKL